MSTNQSEQRDDGRATPTRVFISYSWEDQQHNERVLALAQQLRRDGVETWLDRFTPFPAQGWDRWMHDEIRAARFVLCVITKTYSERFTGNTPRGVGRGVNWEGSVITDRIYHDGGHNEKFVPVLFDFADAEHLPHPLSRYPYFCVAQPAGYDSLYRLLTGQPEVIPEAVGATHPMPALTQLAPLPQPEVFCHRRNLGNLPRLPYFFGREDQLKIIDEALNPTARTWIILIDGPGGVGKTTLAIRAAELTSEEDYPRIVFASAKVRELGPDGVRAVRDFLINSYLDLLNSIARALGGDDIARLEEKERPQALIQLLCEKPALLVLDNLEALGKDDLERLLEFLKHLPHGTKAIITSRRRNDVQAECIRLDKMDWPAAEKLLTELSRSYPPLARASEQERFNLYQNTGGNPLILRWVASQLGLGRGRCRTIEGALSLLRESPTGDSVLEFIFGDLVSTFSPEETKLLAALTYFTQPVEVKHIAELADVGGLVAQNELQNLVERSLVISDVEYRHFILTPLVSDFLRRHKPEIVRESGDRLAKSVYVLAVENGGRRYRRFPVLEKAWPMVEAGLPLLNYDKLQTVCDALADFFGWAGRWDESIALNKLAEEKAVAKKDFRKAGWRACGEAYVMYLKGNAEGVLAAADRAATHWQKEQINPSAFELGILSRRRGMGYELQGDYKAALTAYRETLKLWKSRSSEGEDLARVLNDIADIERRSKHYDAAERDYLEALRIARKADFTEGIIKSTGSRADLALDREQWSEAEALAREALSLANKVSHRELIAVNYRRLAQALAQQGKHQSGLFYARGSVAILTALRSSLTALRSTELDKAEAVLRELEKNKTLRNFDKEEPEKEWRDVEIPLPGGAEEDDRLGESQALYKMGVMLQEQGEHKAAEAKFHEALEARRGSRRTIDEARIQNSLGWTLQQQRRWDEAEQSYREALAICKEINDSEEHRQSEQNLERLKEERALASNNEERRALGAPRYASSSEANPFEQEVRAYEQEDQSSPPPESPVLFYGSSSIRFWPWLGDDFSSYPVLNRGFGGAKLQDCVRLYPRLVKPYAPRVVVLYAGDNDLAESHSPRNILESLKEFLELLSKDFPSTQVAFISIKPSPIRRGQGEIEATNRLIEDFASKRDSLTFLNIYHKMLKADGSPNERLFRDDRLHMSRAGYDIWREVVGDYLSAVWPQAATARPKAGGLNREHHKWISHNLTRQMELLVFGHAGARMLMFPTWRGSFHQYEDGGMVEALRDLLETGSLQLFCVDSFDAHSLYNGRIPPRERILRHLSFENYLLHEVLPFSERKNPNPFLIAHGCSLGASHAVNIAFRHPERFNKVVAFSGRYDLTCSFSDGIPDLFDGYYDEDIYFNTPSHFIPNIADPNLLKQLRKLDVTLGVGEADPFLENNRALSRTLHEKGIYHAFCVWEGKAHDFHHWRERIKLYLSPATC